MNSNVEDNDMEDTPLPEEPTLTLLKDVDQAMGQLHKMAAKFNVETAGEMGRIPLYAQSFGMLLANLVMETHYLRLAQETANAIALTRDET